MENKLKILFFGDITGRQGRTAVKNYLEQLRATNNSADFVIANIENASHGFGLTKKNYIDLSEAGIDCFTSGNHIWDKKDVYEYIDTADNLVRPINYPEGTPGEGCKVFSAHDPRYNVVWLKIFIRDNHCSRLFRIISITNINWNISLNGRNQCFIVKDGKTSIR